MAIFDMLSREDVLKLKEIYQDHLRLIRVVNDEVYQSNRRVDNAYKYIVGYAKKVGWQTNDSL